MSGADPTGRIADVLVALVLFRETRFGQRGSGEEEDAEEPDHPHGEPPKSGAVGEKSLFPC